MLDGLFVTSFAVGNRNRVDGTMPAIFLTPYIAEVPRGLPVTLGIENHRSDSVDIVVQAT